MAFSLEEKVDLLLKKVAFGKTKTNTSENTDGFGESIASPLLLRGDKVMKQSASIPGTPGAVADIVQAYQGTDVVQCTAATGTTDTNITGFKRAWSTGHTNWIPSEFSAAYTVEVYVGPSGWNGSDGIATTIGGTDGSLTGASVFRVVPGVQSANWFFDYQAGVLYWTNEDESGAVGGSEELTSNISSNDVVYIKGYKYIGDFGVGGTSDITGGASTIATTDLDADLALISNGSGKVAVSAITATELNYLNDVSSNIQGQLNSKQDILNFGISNNNIPVFTSGVVDDDFLRVSGTSIEGRSASEVLTDIGAVAKNANITGATKTKITFDAKGLVTAGADLVAGDIPTLNQNTTGTAAGLSATLAIGSGGTGETTSNIWLNSRITTNANGTLNYDGTSATAVNHDSLAGFVAEEHVDWATASAGTIDASNIPTLNQSTTGSAATLTNGRTFKVDLEDTTASTAFDGSANITDVGVAGTLPVANGGTGLTAITTLLNSNVTATTLGLVIGTHVQAFDAQLSDVAGLTPTDSHFIVGDGTNFVTETGSTARTSLGLGSISTQAADSVDIDGGAIDETTIGANTPAAGTFTDLAATGNLTVAGNLTIQGDFIQETSTNVIFEDTFLDLNVPDTATADITSDSGLRFGTGASVASVLDKHAQFMYDATADKFKFTREADAGNFTAPQAKSGADNVAALKFNMDTADVVAQTSQANDLTTMPSDDFANAASARSLGAVAKCSITITNQTGDSGSNFAPDIQGTNGYVIKHNLNTASVYVIAIKDPGGTPTPIFCKYQPIDANIVRVTVGVTADNEVYDIIVIG